MADHVQKRNMVERIDGRMVNAGRLRGMLSVCAFGCCCGHTERGFSPVDTALYHTEWERRKLRNKVHLSQGGCLGPCVLANVALLLMDGRPYWFHSVNDAALVHAIFDFIERLLEDKEALPPPILRPHLFNSFAWERAVVDAAQPLPPTAAPSMAAGEGILFLTQADTDLLTLMQARRLLPADFAPIEAANVGRLLDDADIDAFLDAKLPVTQIVVARLHSARSFEHGLKRLKQWAEQTDGMLLCLPAVEAFDLDLMGRSTVGIPLAQAICVYFQCGGADNLANGLLCLSDHLLTTGWGFEQPKELPLHGLYVAPSGCVGRCAEHTHIDAVQRPTVGILFYRAHLLSGNTEFIDALVHELHAHGLEARAVYTQSLKECDEEGTPIAMKILREAGPVEVVISTLSFAAGDKIDIFAEMDAPIVQALTSSSDLATWQRNGRGLNPLDTAMNVAIPEFDGRIITAPISFKEETEGGAAHYAPHRERIGRLVDIVTRLIALRRKPNREKRIAFIFTNSAAKASRVGNAVGLDAPASLLALLHRMRDEGYVVEGLPASSDELLHNLIDRCSYDATWLTDAQLARAHKVSIGRYTEWYATAPASSRQDMERQWGAPPGKAYIHDGHFALAGLTFGNVFVGLQPPRGYDLNPDEIYHRPDLPPPHNYFALYRWLRDEWRADAIVHMGKHGTLEWLPGKSVGLSNSCFPDLFLADLPLIYPFIINDPGEGSQAKRRCHAVIVDHMTPPMTTAGAYGALAELAQLVDEYYTAEQLDPTKLPLLQRQLWEVIERNRLDDDLRYILQSDHGDHTHDWDGAFLEDGVPTALAELQGAQVAHLLEDIEGYLCELTGAQIRDGLHILGYLPQDEQLIDLLYHLLKLPNLQAPSLPSAVAACLGEDWAELQCHPGARRPQLQTSQPDVAHPDAVGHPPTLSKPLPLLHDLHTNADVLEVVTLQSKLLLRQMADHEWHSAAADEVVMTWVRKHDLATSAPVAAIQEIIDTLRFACDTIVPRLGEGAQAEIDNLIHALNGGHIPPGPSGAPTRGMAHVLPTGRNFYSVDPRSLPTVTSWQVGQGLADDLIARYLREVGDYPESVGISIWGTSVMRTAGDDIAQVLALLGVRPVWQQENRRITGIELIPLEELKRPRIDVVCRISGFFRDAFPHLIALLDNAVQAVIEADEPLEQNFPRKHTLANETLLRLNHDADAARARYRIFGCKPGSYGAGILPLIDAKNWQSDADFARAYLTWGGYAYSATAQGVPAQDEFAAALKTVQVATKNQDNREHDIFDSDDYLQYHGGMIATVRALTGKNPRRYFGDSSDPARVKTRDLREEARRVFRSRVINPKWLASMRRHGYKGALEIAATVDYLFGYDATAQVLEDWMYHTLTEEFLRNEEMQQFFAESNPWAWEAIAERLLEAVERGLWQDPEPLDLRLLNAARALGLEQVRRRNGNEQQKRDGQ